MLFCEKLANTMKLDEIAGDAGLDVNGEALLARAKQLMKREVRRRGGISKSSYILHIFRHHILRTSRNGRVLLFS